MPAVVVAADAGAGGGGARIPKVTERALMKRINRKLARESEVLCKAREGSRDQQECGSYCVVGVANGSGHWRSPTFLYADVNLEALGRELGALDPDEVVHDGDGIGWIDHCRIELVSGRPAA